MTPEQLQEANRSAVLPMLDVLLAEQSTAGYYGTGTLEFTVVNGLIRDITVSPRRTHRVKSAKIFLANSADDPTQ